LKAEKEKSEAALSKFREQVGELNDKINSHLQEFQDYEDSNEPLSEFQRGEREGLTTAKRRIAQIFQDLSNPASGKQEPKNSEQRG